MWIVVPVTESCPVSRVRARLHALGHTRGRDGTMRQSRDVTGFEYACVCGTRAVQVHRARAPLGVQTRARGTRALALPVLRPVSGVPGAGHSGSPGFV